MNEQTQEQGFDATEPAGLERRLQEALAENARLWDEVHRLRAERRDVDYYEDLTEQLTSSASWKLTRPLRSGKAFSARVKSKLHQRRF